MNALIQFLIDLLRRAVPTPAGLMSIFRKAMQNRFLSIALAIYLLVPALIFAVMYHQDYNRRSRYVIESEYIVFLPDQYPDAQFTLKHRARAVVSTASRTINAGLAELEKKNGPGIYADSFAREDGTFVLTLTDYRHQLDKLKGRAELEKKVAPYSALFGKAAAEVVKVLPHGSRVEKLREYFGQRREARFKPYLMYPACILVAFFLYCIILGVLCSAVVDIRVARGMFPEATRILQIRHRRRSLVFGVQLREGRVPEEVRLLGEFVLQEIERGKRSFAITSASPDVGKTTLTLFLAKVLGAYYKVNLHDADARGAATKAFPDLRKHASWAALSVDLRTLSHQLRARFIDQARTWTPAPAADEVNLFDCSPTFAADGGLSLLKEVDVVILVFEELESRANLRASLADLAFLGITPQVVVINKVHSLLQPAYYYGGGYAYRSHPD